MENDPRLPASWSFRAAIPLMILAAAFVASPLRAQQSPQDTGQAGAPAANGAQQTSRSAAPGHPGYTVPSSFTLPAGTLISVRTEQALSSSQNHAGDTFNANLAAPLVVGGWVVARRGQPVIGEVSQAQQAGHLKGRSKLGLELTTLVVADGRQYSIATRLVENSAPSGNAGRAIGTMGTTTAIGAAVGAAAHGGEGAGVGAAIGAGVGLAGLMLTRGRPTVIPPESLLTFQLESPVTFSTEGRELAYQPVTQQDYAPATPRLERRPARMATPPYPPPPPPYYYPSYGYPGWGYAYGYPAPFFIGVYGIGGGYYRGYRGYGRFRRDDRR